MVLLLFYVYFGVDAVVIHHCLANYHKFSGLEHHPLIILQRLWVILHLGTAYLGSLPMVLRGCSKVLTKVVSSSAAQDYVPNTFKMLADSSFLWL